jgi:hypothetical protein
MRRLGLLLVVASAFAAGGCGVLSRGNDSAEPIDDEQLAVMVVPQEQLGPAAKGLNVDDDSGPYGNKEAAQDTVDPRDTAAALAAGGRVGGYELAYSSPKALDIWRSGGGYSDVTTSVELFETPSDAAVYLDTQARDFARFEGKPIGHGVRLTKTDVARITDIGESAWMIRGTGRFGKMTARGTVVAFRRGRIVGAVSISRGDTRDITNQARIIARSLDHRIVTALDGSLEAEPVSLPLEPGPGSVRRLGAMTLSPSDLPAGVSVGSEGREETSVGEVSYARSFNVDGTPFPGSRFLTLKAETNLVADEAEARVALSALGSKHGRELLEKTFKQKFDIPGHTTVVPMPGLPGGMVGSVFTLRTPKGRFEAFQITLRVKNVVETLTSFSQAGAADPADLEALAVKARARLESAL